ncbi:hypothetical protein LguiA_035562 [Lonicera macranthoides]
MHIRVIIRTIMDGITIFLLFSSLFSIFNTSTAIDTIAADQGIRDGNSIISASEMFELGFFNPGSSTNRYMGIWYRSISTGTVVWVANREIPLTDTSGVLNLKSEGNLVLVNGTHNIIWSSNSSRSIKNPVAQLLDTGNLVIRDANNTNPENFFWQSFDYPGDSFLPGMKLGIDFVKGVDRYLTSWKSLNDPSPGNFTQRFNPNGYPQLLLSEGSVVRFSSGPWNGLRFSGMPSLEPNSIYTYEFACNETEIYYKYELVSSSVVTRMVLNPSGDLQRFIWIDRTQSWILYLAAQMDNCDRYDLCGPYGSCNINNSPACGCLKGFKPKFPGEWEVADWSKGCEHKAELECGNGEGFVKYSGVKLPDTSGSWFDARVNLEECERICLNNCSCTAYANMDVRGRGSGCLLWFSELVDVREYIEKGQDLYVRMAASELERKKNSRIMRRLRIIVIPGLLILTVLLGVFLFLHILKRRKVKKEGIMRLGVESDGTANNEREDLDLPLFNFITISKATNNFSHISKLGQGGYGPVYKGMLDDGQEIAVKRLSKTSKQGLDEFMNEVLCIAKLQHRNLVKLLGCCIEEGERMLIYEYMPNKSLDSFIFDTNQSKLLDWSMRNNIINGIARGILYLHQDSRLRIIHRDLKASNILLDYDMNPKISDFGMARRFGGSETEADTTRVVGTYGYMSPEYAIHGHFSIKSDVFSFGVMVLEIVSGKQNRGFCHPEHSLNLLGHAWKLHKEGKLLELIDAGIWELGNECELFRAIHIGLLCVQQYPDERPSMPTVVMMLGSNVTALPQPKTPGFFTDGRPHESDSSSTNQLSLTILTPR